MSDPSRRRLLRAGASALAVSLAGCVGGPQGEVGGASPTSMGGGTVGTTGDGGDLDLREANVVGVTFERSDGEVRFDVTLHHDDDGEEGYANWWQVETLGGERLGRRDLLHAHGSRAFTRSATVTVPEGVSCVVVRGHDQIHGYGGRAVLANLDTGATRGVRQGSGPRSFVASECP